MKVAVAAAVLAAFVLGLAISGEVGRVPSAARSDTINLKSEASASPTPSSVVPGDPERVSRHVESWDDKGGERRDAEREAEDSSRRGSAEDQGRAPAEDREDNSGRRSRNSGSGSENSGSGSIDSDLRGEDD